MATDEQVITIGSVNTGGSTFYPWPDAWNTPLWQPTNSYFYTTPTAEEYANEVEVFRGDHDATLKFYRRRDRSRSLVKEITVPLGVLDWLTKEA